MEERIARTIVRVYGAIAWVAGLLLLETALGLLRIPTPELEYIFGPYVRAVMLLISCFLIFFGFPLQKYKPWSRIVAITMSWILVLGGIFLMVICLHCSFLIGPYTSVLRILLGGFGIWFFSTRTVKHIFDGRMERS